MAYQTINPATGTLVREFATITDDELDTVVSHAHETFRMDWQQRPVPDRASIVAGAVRKLRASGKECAAMASPPSGRSSPLKLIRGQRETFWHFEP